MEKRVCQQFEHIYLPFTQNPPNLPKETRTDST